MPAPHDLSRLVPEHRAIVEHIRALYPDESDADLADTIEGMSGLPDAIIAVLRHVLAREAMADGLAKLIEQMTARKRRLDDGAKQLRAAALNAMSEAGLKRLDAPDMTVSLGAAKASVVITEPESVPDHLCRIKREPSKTLIAEALRAGQTVPGAVLGNGQATLTIRRS